MGENVVARHIRIDFCEEKSNPFILIAIFSKNIFHKFINDKKKYEMNYETL